MTWEKLSARSSKRTDMPAIGIQKNGRIAWNFGTQKALGEPEFVELLIDRKTKRLGLRSAEKDEDNFPVRRTGRQRTWGISALGALNAEGLSVESAYRRYAEIADDVVFIDISELFTDF